MAEPNADAPPPARGGGSARARRFLLSGSGRPYLLVPFIPIAILLELNHAEAAVIFGAAAAGVIPTAALMGRATEELAHRSGPGIGGLQSVTFGNGPAMIIAIFALNAGLQEVVKASIIGSILGNILLVMGAAMLLGGLKRRRQTFNSTAASVQASMLRDPRGGVPGDHDRQPRHPGRRVDLVRGPATLGRLCRPRRRLLLRMVIC